eukprot:7352136-Prymnesium_polylepis.2
MPSQHCLRHALTCVRSPSTAVARAMVLCVDRRQRRVLPSWRREGLRASRSRPPIQHRQRVAHRRLGRCALRTVRDRSGDAVWRGRLRQHFQGHGPREGRACSSEAGRHAPNAAGGRSQGVPDPRGAPGPSAHHRAARARPRDARRLGARRAASGGSRSLVATRSKPCGKW